MLGNIEEKTNTATTEKQFFYFFAQLDEGSRNNKMILIVITSVTSMSAIISGEPHAYFLILGVWFQVWYFRKATVCVSWFQFQPHHNGMPMHKGHVSRSSSIFQKVQKDHQNLSELVNDRLNHLDLATDQPCELRNLYFI